MPPNSGSTVQEHTASSVPATEATPKAIGRRGRAEVLHHRALADIDGHRACDDEGRQQAKDDVLAGVPLSQAKAFEYGILEARLPQRQEEDQQKCGRHAKQHLGFARAVTPETRRVSTAKGRRQPKEPIARARSCP